MDGDSFQNVGSDVEAYVLIVDDDHELSCIAAMALRSPSCHIETARSADEALALMEAQLPDCLVLDICMPGMDGFQLLQKLRCDWNFNPRKVVMLSALLDVDTMHKARSAGVHSFVPKPYVISDLRAKVRQCLEDSKAVRSEVLRSGVPKMPEDSVTTVGDLPELFAPQTSCK